MPWTVKDFNLEGGRILALEADSTQELDVLIEKAKAKGWNEYVDGRVPSNGRYGAWLTKPTESAKCQINEPK